MQLLGNHRFVGCPLVTFSVAVDFSIFLSEVTSHTLPAGWDLSALQSSLFASSEY